MTATLISTVIGKGLLAGALGDLYLFIKSSVYNERLEQVLEELDIKSELDIVQALLSDLADNVECRVVKVSSEQMRESVELIHKELEEIQKELDQHKNRYFSSWRTPNYNKNLQKLAQHRNILRKRRELLISAISVQKNLDTEKKRNIIDRILN